MNNDTKKVISDEVKKKIAIDLRTYVDVMAEGSANKASKMLKGVSNAYISHVLKGNWHHLSDDAWRNIQKQVSRKDGQVVIETRPFKDIQKIYFDAKTYSRTRAIIGNAGVGKTIAAENTNLDNVFVLKCEEYWSKFDFLEELLRILGRKSVRRSASAMMKAIIEAFLKLDTPLLIIDEADKLDDKVLYFFISLYNSLFGKCALILQATPYLKTRIENGVNGGKKGFEEINSRLCGVFIEVRKSTKTDVKNIANARGFEGDDMTIAEIYNQGFGDLRIVDDLIHAHLKSAS